MKSLSLLLVSSLVASAAQVRDKTREAVVDARTGNVMANGDDEFWKQFRAGNGDGRPSGGSGDDNIRPAHERMPRSAPVDPEESEAPPKISPIKEDDFDNVPYEHGGLLVMNDSTGRRLAMKQQRNDGNLQEIKGTRDIIEKSARYLQDTVLADDKYSVVYTDCNNKHELCSFWAFVGQCAGNPNYMIRDDYCLLACNRCDKLLLNK